jgi:predicted nucleic acid-binding protein
MQIFLDYCVLNDALRDASVLAKLRLLRRDHQLVTSTTVVGEALSVMMEGDKEVQYMLVDLVRDLRLLVLQPKKGWQDRMAHLDEVLRRGGVDFVSSAELAHMSLAILWSVDLYITSRPEARNLSKVPELERTLRVVDLEQAKELVSKLKGNN